VANRLAKSRDSSRTAGCLWLHGLDLDDDLGVDPRVLAGWVDLSETEEEDARWRWWGWGWK
jgi:hypothetical protein